MAKETTTKSDQPKSGKPGGKMTAGACSGPGRLQKIKNIKGGK